MAKVKLGDRVELLEDWRCKKGHRGLVVGTTGDNQPLILFDDYHKGHNGKMFSNQTTYFKGYSYERLCEIGDGCLWIPERILKPIKQCLLKSLKGGK